MSDEQNSNTGTPPPAEAAPDRVKNLQSEFDRKLQNVTAELQRIAAAIPQPAPQQQSKKKLAELAYSDEDGFERELDSRVEAKAAAIVENMTAKQARQNAVIQDLYKDFPEIGDMENPLTKRALEIHASLSAEEKGSPMAYKLAVKDAALELGVKPKSKRAANNDESFQLGGGGNPPPRKQKEDIDTATTDFARALGVDVSDVKVKERLKNYSSRRNWNKFE